MHTVYLLNPLIMPNIGLMFWTLLVFLGLLFILRKFAWGPILSGLKEREQSISDALNEAKNAREEMSHMKSENEALLAEARAERDKILREGKEIRDKMVADAKSCQRSGPFRARPKSIGELGESPVYSTAGGASLPHSVDGCRR